MLIIVYTADLKTMIKNLIKSLLLKRSSRLSLMQAMKLIDSPKTMENHFECFLQLLKSQLARIF